MKKIKRNLMKFLLDKYFEKTKGFYPFFKYCPDKYKIHYINRRASETLGYEYNYLNPRTFNEKIRWLIYNEKLKIKSMLTDKIKVKTYINEKLGSGHCAQIYGIWNNFNDIDFSYLPPKCVLKSNHAWNTNIFLENKHLFKTNKQRKNLKCITDNWLKINYEDYSLEPQYKFIKPYLFIEQMLDGIPCIRSGFQVHCFNGEPIMTEVQQNINTLCFYDNNRKVLPYNLKGCELKEAPINHGFFDEMLKCAKILAEGFSYVRVDFANLTEKVVVLEMTFTPHSAIMPFASTSHDFELGKILKI